LAILRISDLVPTTSRDERLLQEADFLESCMILDGLGGGVFAVRVAPGIPGKISQRAVQTQVVNALRRLSGMAAPFEIEIALESDTDLPNIQEARIVEQVDRHNVGLAIRLEPSQLEMDTAAIGTVDPRKVRLVYLDGRPGHALGTSQQVAADLERLQKRGSRPTLVLCFPTGHSTPGEAARAAMRQVQELDLLCEDLSLIV
jgi:hypothetical protein